MSDVTERPDIPGFLAGVPLLDGIEQADLEELARLLRRRDVPAGAVLWQQGDKADSMLLVFDGRVSVTLRLPGERAIEVASLGRGEVIGEIPLLDGGERSAGAHASEPTTLLVLSRSDFASLVQRRHPTAYALKRRIAAIACARLRSHLATVAATLGDEPAPATETFTELEPSGPPDSAYVRRLATFRSFEPLAVWGFLTAGRYARCPPARTLVAEGGTSEACYVVINGAVEKVVARGGRRARVGLAGPGHVFGYESLIDGGPSPVTATTRERTLLLVVPPEAFARLFHGETPGSHVFLDVVIRDLMAALRQSLRPHARLASSL